MTTKGGNNQQEQNKLTDPKKPNRENKKYKETNNILLCKFLLILSPECISIDLAIQHQILCLLSYYFYNEIIRNSFMH
jgi:hypothetical protein